MTVEQKNVFIERINSVKEDDKALFGKMNVNQMIAHCADQFRVAFGEIDGLVREIVDMAEIRGMAARGETVPTPKGLNQVLGEGTKPTDLETDKKILFGYINRFYETPDDYPFSFHPFFGDMNKTGWNRLVLYHLEHHLKQFGR